MAAIMVWLDDERDPADFSRRVGWTWVRTAPEALALLAAGRVAVLSLDHDLGEHPDAGDGYQVAAWLEEQAHTGRPDLVPADLNVHSANPVGAARMRAALRSAQRAAGHPVTVPA